MARKSRKKKIVFGKRTLKYGLAAGLFVAFLFGVYFCARYFFLCFPWGQRAEADNKPFRERVSQTLKKESGDILVFSSFFDSFASDHLIDFDKTNLYRNHPSAAVMFPPDYLLAEAEVDDIRAKREELTTFDFRVFPASSTDYQLAASSEKRCLSGRCLEQIGGEIFYEGKKISPPSELLGREILAVTLGAIERSFLVGWTVRGETKSEEKSYEGLVYSFNGKKFSQVIRGGELVSRYFGLLGFGGTEDDFLVVYGAYLGQAFRFQGNRVTDISHFFDYRFMAKGFRPEVIRVERNRLNYWYIFSLSADRPRLLKLWPDKNDRLVGKIDYQDIFNGNDHQGAVSFLRSKNEEIELLIYTLGNGVENWRVFKDRGFKNEQAGELFFRPVINDFVEPEIIVEKLANSSLGNKETPCAEAALYFSTDSASWQPVPQGYYLNKNFNSLHISKYFLRVDFPAQKDRFYSPFLSEVLFDFYYRK